MLSGSLISIDGICCQARPVYPRLKRSFLPLRCIDVGLREYFRFFCFWIVFSFFNFINLVLSYSHTGVAARLCYLISISGQGLARLGAAHGPAEFWPGFPV